MLVSYAPTFIRLLKTLPEDLQDETIEKIELFKNPRTHLSLKVHKLKGRLKGRYGFSVNYRTRIVFIFLKSRPRTAHLLAIGDHEVYNL